MGVLKVLKGPLSTIGKKNRNGRIYSRELWENVLNSEYWQDMMTNNTLFGECVHPADNRSTSDPFEIDANNVSHRIKEAHIEGDKLMGTVEILDTAAGRNIASLIDSGCNIGISARGAGDLNGDEVDADTYQFKTFDLTFRPSDFNARLVPLTESERKTFKAIKESEETDILENIDSPEIKESENVLHNLYNRIVNTFKESSVISNLGNNKCSLNIIKTTSDIDSYKVDLNILGENAKTINIGYITESISNEDLKIAINSALNRIK